MADSKPKLPIAILIILVVLSLSWAGATFYLFQKERAKNLALQEDLEETRTKQQASEAKLQESKKLVSQLESKLGQAQSQIDALTADLEQEKNAKDKALTLIEQLRIDLDQREGLRSDLEKKFAQAQKDLGDLQGRIKELESKKAELETKIKVLETQSQGVELGKIVVSPEKPKETSSTTFEASLEGKVLVVNKDYNFAVINLGSKDGIDIGSVFSVYHNNKYLGDIKVEKIYDSMSAAGFVSSDLKDKINEGDTVLRKSK